jgi:hypothetical protein
LDTLDLLLQVRGGTPLGGLHALLANEIFERDGDRFGSAKSASN